MYAPVPPASASRGRTAAILLLLVATAVYGLSLFPWFVMLIMSPMMYDSPDNTGTANVLIIGILGWPIVVVGGLVAGWIYRTMRSAVTVTIAPLVWVLVIVGWTEAINPTFFNIVDFMPTPKTLNAEDRQLARFALGADPQTTVAAAGLPVKARVDGNEVSPDQAAAETGRIGFAIWEYPSGATIHFAEGKVSEIEIDAPFSGKTARGVTLGDTMDRVRERYGEPGEVGTSTGPNGQSETYRYYGKDFTMVIGGDPFNLVRWITMRVEN